MYVHASLAHSCCMIILTAGLLSILHTMYISRCPEGYMIGRLEPHHAELVASNWTHSRSEHKASWIRELIEKYASAAAFPIADLSQPVAWILQYGQGGIGNLYTLESHRRKGLGLAVAAALCQQVMETYPDGVLPHCQTVEGNVSSYKLFEKLGFVPKCPNYYFERTV